MKNTLQRCCMEVLLRMAALGLGRVTLTFSGGHDSGDVDFAEILAGTGEALNEGHPAACRLRDKAELVHSPFELCYQLDFNGLPEVAGSLVYDTVNWTAHVDAVQTDYDYSAVPEREDDEDDEYDSDIEPEPVENELTLSLLGEDNDNMYGLFSWPGQLNRLLG